MWPLALYFFCYVALFIFGVGLIIRAVKIASLPVHLRWELAPVPHEKNKSSYGGSYLEEFEWWTKKREKSLISEMWYMFQEIFFLKGVWEHNRSLWIFSLPFHHGLYFVIGMMGLFIASAIVSVAGYANVADHLNMVAKIMAWLGYVLGSIGAIGLFLSRLCVRKLRTFASFAAYFNLVFLAALFISGWYILATFENFHEEMAMFWKRAITADFQHLPASTVTVHLVICFSFLVYLPFSYMMHFVAKYFTYHQIRWDDTPMTPGSKIEKEVQKLLAQPVTWSAKHVHADGKKNWVDIATEEVGKNE